MKLSFFRRPRGWLSREDGATMVIVALAMAAMLGISALVIDIGTLNIEKSKLQNALDASALAGAQSLPDQSGALSSARSYFTANGYDSADLTVTFPDSETVRCASSAEVQTTFARVLGISSTSTHELHATAIKTKRSVKSPFDYAVFQGEPGKLLDMGGGAFTVNGGVFSNGAFRSKPGGTTTIKSLETVSNTNPDILSCVKIGSVSKGVDAVGMVDMQDYFDGLKNTAVSGKTFKTATKSELSDWQKAWQAFTLSGSYTVNGDFKSGGLCIINDVLIVNGDFTAAGVQINPGGALIVNGSADIAGYGDYLPTFKGALIYVTGNLSVMPGGTGMYFNGENNIYVGGSMTLGGSGISATNSNFFCCQNGNLTVTANCSSINMSCVLYAYTGTVVLQSRPNIYGAVIGSTVNSFPAGVVVNYPTDGLGIEITEDAFRLID